MLTRLRLGELHGLNVTLPHKQTVIPLLDELTETAQAIGAVNTIFVRHGRLTGDNTDAPGFLADLRRLLSSIENRTSFMKNSKSALVLGAGGAARAVVYALVNDGWEVTVAARRLEQAQELACQYPSQVASCAWPNLPKAALIVNATPLGMAPDTGASPWPAGLPFPPEAIVYDLVYNPQETKLVKDARAAGLPAVTGLGMLVEQAALAFALWTGCLPPFADLMSAVHG